ncbi:MAG: hypothetical protein ABFD46_11905 [Armatimonadota bacterium]
MTRNRWFAVVVSLLILICSCLILNPLVGCCSAENTAYTRLTVDEAEKLVQDWVKKNRDRCYWHNQPKLKELTTEDIWQQLHVQVFKLKDHTESISEIDAYLVKNGKVYPMCTGFGGHGLTDMCVCDIDKDSKDELVYIYSWGSGIHRSLVCAYRFGKTDPFNISLAFSITNVDIKLEKRDKNKVDLWTADGKFRFGELIYQQQAGKQSLSIICDATLPKELKNCIWNSGSSLH